MLIGGLTFAGALVGGLLATFVVAPRIIARQAPAAAHGDSTVAGGEGSGSAGETPADGKGGEGAGSEKKMVELSNIIVNPAGSQGTRFLMARSPSASRTRRPRRSSAIMRWSSGTR